MDKVIIGWREWIDLPEWGLRLKAKIDTGAKSSSLDVVAVKRVENNIHYTVRLSRKKSHTLDVVSPLHRMTIVKSSNGQRQERYFVLLPIVLGGIAKNIEVSLACRKNMLHRMLLGREALQEHFLIDAGVDHLTVVEKKKKPKK
ncbi:MAG: RimK/LysX family protein [Lentisphaeraceae bacterium]|nr:RimK/LysX family protein [Lentisphaeraceae bacterium]